MSSPVGVLLAAGLGTRYDPSGGSSKLLVPTQAGAHAGAPIVVAAARNLMAAVERVVAVVRPRDHAHQPHLHELLQNEGCELVICERAAEGMGASLSCGIRASSDAPAWIVALGDMPAIDPSTITAVVAALRAGYEAVAPTYKGQRGHPVGFSSACLAQLLASSGDQGARSVLRRSEVHLIDVVDARILVDVDLTA